MRALVVGGTGPTGPYIVDGLRARGYEVAIFHRGTHEIDEIAPDVEHIHGDPHFRETIDAALDRRSFDLVVATYGRLRHVAESTAGRAGRFIAVGGFALYRGFLRPGDLHPAGLPVPVNEDFPVVTSEAEQRFSWLITRSEEAVLAAHPTATVFRYPYVYGPRQLVPREWCVVRRVLDGRPFVIVPDAGLGLVTHGFAENLAHAVLLAVDQPERAAGRIYNCGDDTQLTIAQIVEVIASALGRDVEIVSMPKELAAPARPLVLGWYSHVLLDVTRIRDELGYRDLVPAAEAMARTARWYANHPLERGGELEMRLGDPFDYAAEDDLVERYRRLVASFDAHKAARTGVSHHPYPHPTQAGLARDHRNR